MSIIKVVDWREEPYLELAKAIYADVIPAFYVQYASIQMSGADHKEKTQIFPFLAVVENLVFALVLGEDCPGMWCVRHN